MGYSPQGGKESDMTERLHSLTHSLYNIYSGFPKQIGRKNQTILALNYYNTYVFKSNAKTLESVFPKYFFVMSF